MKPAYEATDVHNRTHELHTLIFEIADQADNLGCTDSYRSLVAMQHEIDDYGSKPHTAEEITEFIAIKAKIILEILSLDPVLSKKCNRKTINELTDLSA